jgi:hypothetical protein
MDARAEAERLRRETYAFLDSHTIDQPFSAADFAVRVGLDLENATELLHELARQGDVHQSQGGWQPGREPPTPTVDQL